MADAITDAMIEAGRAASLKHYAFPLNDDHLREIYLAMEAARQPQLPSDDGLIKALEDLFAGGFIEAGTRLEGQWASELVVRLKPLREALSRHKAPLSVRDQVERDKEAFASLSPGERQAAQAELHSIGQNPGVEFAPLSVAGDDAERVARAWLEASGCRWCDLSPLQKTNHLGYAHAAIAALQARPSVSGDDVAPIPMMLFCPKCGLQHIDMPDPTDDWDNPPHKSHKCVGPNGCGTVWRPADVPTEGVAAIQTRGPKDTVFYNYAALTARQPVAGDDVERTVERLYQIALSSEGSSNEIKQAIRAALTALQARPSVAGDDVERVLAAGKALIADVRRRYPGEALRCPLMIELDAALHSKQEGEG